MTQDLEQAKQYENPPRLGLREEVPTGNSRGLRQFPHEVYIVVPRYENLIFKRKRQSMIRYMTYQGDPADIFQLAVLAQIRRTCM